MRNLTKMFVEKTPDATIQAFKHMTFSKIPEFLSFYERLASSIQRINFRNQMNRVFLIQKCISSIDDAKEYVNSLSADYFALDTGKFAN